MNAFFSGSSRKSRTAPAPRPGPPQHPGQVPAPRRAFPAPLAAGSNSNRTPSRAARPRIHRGTAGNGKRPGKSRI